MYSGSCMLFPFYLFNTLNELVLLPSISASLWMAPQLESSRTMSQLVFHSQRNSQWGYTPASGTPMIGQLEEGLSKRIGHKHPLLPLTGTSMPKPVCGPMVHLLAEQMLHPQSPTVMRGSQKTWIRQANRGWSGYREITWFITIAPTVSASHRDPLLSVPLPRHPSYRNEKIAQNHKYGLAQQSSRFLTSCFHE